MHDNVIILKVVFTNRDIVKIASHARKSATRYDLTCLMIRSERLLCVIIEDTPRCQKIPEHAIVVMCNFPIIKDVAYVTIASFHYVVLYTGVKNYGMGPCKGCQYC